MLYLISLETFFQKHISRKPRRTTTRTRHPVHMSSHAARTAVTDTSGGIASGNTPASLADPQAAIPDLPDHVVVNHILRSEYFDDPADLARLPAVSRGMRAAVAETGLRFEELGEKDALDLGCLSALQRRQRGGHLSSQELLCQAAARWKSRGVEGAARGRLAVGQVDVHICGRGRAPRDASMGARERLSVGRKYVRVGGEGRATRGAAVGAREWVPVERKHVLEGGGGRTLRGASVGARERLFVEPANAHICCTRGHTGVGGGERRTRIVWKGFG